MWGNKQKGKMRTRCFVWGQDRRKVLNYKGKKMEVELGTLESNIVKFRDLSWWSFYKSFGNIIQAAGAPKARGLRFGWEGLQRVKAR